MVGEAQDRLQPRQAPYAVTALEPIEQGRPVEALEVVGQRLRPLVAILRIAKAEERPPEPMVRPDQPQHQVGVVRISKARVGCCQAHRQRLVAPPLGQPGPLPGPLL